VGQPTWVSSCGARVPTTDAGAGAGAGRGMWAVRWDMDAGAAQVSEPRPDVRTLGVPIKQKNSSGAN
jgi:hypothetical protein